MRWPAYLLSLVRPLLDPSGGIEPQELALLPVGRAGPLGGGVGLALPLAGAAHEAGARGRALLFMVGVEDGRHLRVSFYL